MEIRIAKDKEILEILTHWKTVLSEATAEFLYAKKDSELPPLAPFFMVISIT